MKIVWCNFFILAAMADAKDNSSSSNFVVSCIEYNFRVDSKFGLYTFILYPKIYLT